jgi:glutamine synthetase
MASSVFLVDEQIRSLLDQSITRHYLSTLPAPDSKVCAEYVWIGGTGADLRSKGRTLNFKPTKPEVRPAILCHLAIQPSGVS